MGGNAFLIQGKLSGKKAAEKYSVVVLGKSELVELESDDLEALVSDFKKYMKTAIPDPHAATKYFLGYLDIKISVYLRGERAKGEKEFRWSVQISFSGCAGMGDVSADFAVHCACHWYLAHSEKLRSGILNPFGFIPDEKQDLWGLKIKYAPIGDIGYAQYDPETSIAVGLEPHLGLDGAIHEMWDGEEYDQVVEKLTAAVVPLLTDGPCRCQLCSPDFQPVHIENKPKIGKGGSAASEVLGILRFVFFESRLWLGYSAAILVFFGSNLLKPEHAFLAFALKIPAIGLFAVCLLLSFLRPVSGTRRTADKEMKSVQKDLETLKKKRKNV